MFTATTKKRASMVPPSLSQENKTMNASQIVNGAGNEVWDRLPNKGYYFGMSRPYVYQLIQRGAVKTALIKSPGRVRGIRLVWRPSVLAFIESNVVAGV
jgi:hypothetical protein